MRADASDRPGDLRRRDRASRNAEDIGSHHCAPTHRQRFDVDDVESAAPPGNSMKPRSSFIPAFLLAAAAATSPLIAAQPGAEQTDFFERQIRPILANRCYECH